jgi:hypothetical protein
MITSPSTASRGKRQAGIAAAALTYPLMLTKTASGISLISRFDIGTASCVRPAFHRQYVRTEKWANGLRYEFNRADCRRVRTAPERRSSISLPVRRARLSMISYFRDQALWIARAAMTA